jgi:hypothetical protein
VLAKKRAVWKLDPEKYRTKQRTAWAKKRDQRNANQRTYRLAHIEDELAWQRASRQKHIENVRAADRERSKTPSRRLQAKAQRAKNGVVIAARTNAWKDANPMRVKELAKAAKQRARANQDVLAGRPRPTVCDICGRSDRIINFDHDHQRGHFRGWICNQDNMALGLIGDDVATLRKMIAYLERHRENTAPQLALPGV